MSNVKHTGASFQHLWNKVRKFIIPNILKIIGITLKIIGKESKL